MQKEKKMGFLFTIVGVIFKVVCDVLVGNVGGENSEFASGLFTGLAVILTIIGVLKTLIKAEGAKGKLGGAAFHGVIWLVGTVLLRILVPIVIVAVLAFIVCQFFLGIDVLRMIGRLFGVAASGTAEKKEDPLEALPTIVYDNDGVQYFKQRISGDHVEYAADGGKTLTIYNTDISGNSAQTNAGNIHWYV